MLLDVDMVGHVTDFGIAKLIGATFNDSLTSTAALKGFVGYIPPGMDFLKHYVYLYFLNNNLE